MLGERTGPLQPLLTVANWIRRLVSKNRRRFTEDGFDLDLGYITSRIIAMGYPGEGRQGLIRNPMQEIVRFLQLRHGGSYKVYNLCQERSHWYSPGKMGGEVAMYQFEDHQVPPLRLVDDFCQDAIQWLQKDPQNVIAVHCKAGKGRTGIMICCLLIYMGICRDAFEAIALFASKRTKNNKGVTIPSQLRYIHYYDRVFNSREDLTAVQSINLFSLRISGLPVSMQKRIVLAVWVRPPGKDKRILTLSRVTYLGNTAWGCINLTSDGQPSANEHVDIIANRDDILFVFKSEANDQWRVEGDVKIHAFYKSASSWNSMFYTWLNTGLLPSNNQVSLKRKDLDKVKNWVPSEVRLRVDFSTVGPNGRQCLPPSSPPQSLADTAHADEDLYAGFTGMKGACAGGNLLLDSGSGVSEDSEIETAPLVTKRHLSYPAAATQPYPNIQRSHSFMPSLAKSSWSILDETWNEKWYKS